MNENQSSNLVDARKPQKEGFVSVLKTEEHHSSHHHYCRSHLKEFAQRYFIQQNKSEFLEMTSTLSLLRETDREPICILYE